VLAQHLNLPWQAIALAAIPMLAALMLYQGKPSIRLVAILAIACLGGMLRFFVSQPTIDANHIAFYNDAAEPVTLIGLVVAEPDVRDDHINLRVQAESLQQGQTQQPVDGLLLVRAPRYPERYYGERLSITGQLETPPIFEGFDYKDYLARSGIHTIMRRPGITLLASNQGHLFWRTMFRLRAYTSATINRILAEPHASLLNGILLGLETGIPRRLYEQFNLTGTSHIIVISGSNIAIGPRSQRLVCRWSAACASDTPAS
jgi:competence protein ComEC